MVRQPKGKSEKESKRFKHIWVTEQGKPTLLFISIVIIIAIILAIWGISKIIGSEHEITVVVDCDDSWQAEIHVHDLPEYTSGTGPREITFIMRKGEIIEVYIQKISGSSNPLTVTIYDNGEKVREDSTVDAFGIVWLEYRVKD